MPISIKSEETVRLARALKLRTDKPTARVIHEALEESFERLNSAGPNPGRRLAEIRAISRRVARLPERDAPSADEIIGYDENGLPS